MTDNEKAVIIGCYINGAKPLQIASLLHYSEDEVKLVISEYEKQNGKIKKDYAKE